ncbi:MAG: UDP-N-acetylmuramoyl-L-alanyl-D-glutamate--2,6-diaminopimelate ligase [Myxococcales bacterium]|nr:UDP-N-acetylmuramoyl-L-alanyl-D-glutamate--2,6-diaminopimelate ligase [Myxococcales bacterium]
MLLSQLIADLPWAAANQDVEVRRALVDSRQVQPGDLFVAIRGQQTDGAKFVPQALAAGAVAIAAEDDIDTRGVPLVRVADARRFAAVAAHRLAGDPTADLTLIGVTGTNGKTSVTYLLEAILREQGREVGVIGTVNTHYDGIVTPNRFTTPEAPELVQTLLEMKAKGVDTVVMEVSSHALQLRRVTGCQFDVGVFTNLSRDHLDFHGELDAYLAAKKRLFDEILPVSASVKPRVFAAVNLEDPAGLTIRKATPVPTVGFGGEGQVYWREVICDFDGIRGRLQYGDRELEIGCPLLGDFQAMNILAAAAVCLGLRIDGELVRAGLAKCRHIPGRLEPVGHQDFLVLVDYAHTPDALANVGSTMRRLARGRLLVVFGCGGDRDRGKRPLMGAAVAQQADLTLVTSDNPRTETPQAIIEQILPGVERMGRRRIEPSEVAGWNNGPVYAVEPDRAKAIQLVVRAARPGDVVLIAGKGHEDYQIIGSARIHFDDREVAAAALAARLKA